MHFSLCKNCIYNHSDDLHSVPTTMAMCTLPGCAFSFETNEILVNSLKSTTKIINIHLRDFYHFLVKVAWTTKRTTIGVLVTDTALCLFFM